MSAESSSPENPWPTVFETIAGEYDQSGVPWFQPIARGLLDLLEPCPGERFLELGPGRGALTLALAEAVGAEGRVDAIDIAPSMVRLLQEEARGCGLSRVQVAVGDASRPEPPAPPYDGIGSSLVIFFLPHPVAALREWRRLLRPRGRVGVATFRPWTGALEQLLSLVPEYAGEGPSNRGGSPFDTDEGVAGLFDAAAFQDVRTVGRTYQIPFESLEQWRRWSRTTALQRLWSGSDPARHEEILARVGGILDGSRGPDGRMTLEVSIRYTLARA
jgi:SAM-dependent methyltransferase